MDEAIARTTHRESKDASSSHVTGSNMFSSLVCVLSQMQEHLRACSEVPQHYYFESPQDSRTV